MKSPYDVEKREYLRMLARLTISEARMASLQEPHRIYWVIAVRCPGCHRHIVAFAVVAYDGQLQVKKPKFTIATCMRGEIVPRGLAH